LSFWVLWAVLGVGKAGNRSGHMVVVLDSSGGSFLVVVVVAQMVAWAAVSTRQNRSKGNGLCVGFE